MEVVHKAKNIRYILFFITVSKIMKINKFVLYLASLCMENKLV